MKVFLFLVLTVCLVGSAHAQQAPTPPSPAEQVIGSELLDQINAKLACRTANLTLQHELVKAQARIKELEDKYEPKPKPADKPKT